MIFQKLGHKRHVASTCLSWDAPSQNPGAKNGVLWQKTTKENEPLPSLRRGRKRRCKTKHLEQNGSLKKLRQSSGEVGLAPTDPVLREMEQKLQQEEEDRQLALQLQRMFDNERRTVSRRKGSVDQPPA